MRYLVLLLMVSGCSTTLVHRTKGEADFRADLYGCRRDAAPMLIPARQQAMIAECMGLKGWERQ